MGKKKDRYLIGCDFGTDSVRAVVVCATGPANIQMQLYIATVTRM